VIYDTQSSITIGDALNTLHRNKMLSIGVTTTIGIWSVP
jgi:hypothetical protein